MIVNDIQRRTLQIADTLTIPSCTYLVIQYKMNIGGVADI